MNTADSEVILESVPVLTGSTMLVSEGPLTEAGETTVNTDLAETYRLGAGDPLYLKDHGGTTISIRVMGVVSGSKGEGALYTTRGQLATMGTNTNYQNLYATTKPGADVRTLHDQVGDVAHATGSTTMVSTTGDMTVQNAVEGTADGSTTSALISLLAPVCAVVTIIVITTTLTTFATR